MFKVKRKDSQRNTLSDKISKALTIKPRADIEDDHVFGTKPKTITSSELNFSESEDEAIISDFRKRNVNLLSEISKKYDGQIVSKKISEDDNESVSEDDVDEQADAKLEENLSSEAKSDSEEFESDEGESDDYSIVKIQKQSEGTESDNEESDEDDENGYDISQIDVPPLEEDFEHMKKQNVSEEAKKGNCVRNQLLIWESLLEMRIHLQRCVNTANQMPMPDVYDKLKQENEFLEECNIAKANIGEVLDKFITLRNLLLDNFPDTKQLASKNKQKKVESDKKQEHEEEIPSDTDNEEIPSDTDEEQGEKPDTQLKKSDKTSSTKKRKLEDYERDIAESHKAFKTFRDMTIQKWNEKTRLATAVNKKNTPTNPILQQISYILSDKDKLVRRTQLKRSEYEIVGYKKPTENNLDADSLKVKDRKDDDEYIPDIFDDSDFYHQLLRELIECKSADISDPVQLSRQWIALQQMRNKMKRKVDTKATKGRKIKYVIHNKLVNFLAPEKTMVWTDESKDELYSSLFGKMFEHNNIGVNS